jgi:hypothetical protein
MGIKSIKLNTLNTNLLPLIKQVIEQTPKQSARICFGSGCRKSFIINHGLHPVVVSGQVPCIRKVVSNPRPPMGYLHTLSKPCSNQLHLAQRSGLPPTLCTPASLSMHQHAHIARTTENIARDSSGNPSRLVRSTRVLNSR